MVKCICINDKYRPEEVPVSHWVKTGKEYHVVGIYRMVQPGAVMGVILKEIDLNELDGPYECFRIQRFGFREEDKEALIELIENCEGFQEFDPMKLLENQELEVVEI